MRNTVLVEREFYHIYNRGADKRPIFKTKEDIERFLESMRQFNTTEVIGNLGRNKSRHEKSTKIKNDSELVNFVTYCLNQNHYHFILQPIVEKGLERFMHKLGMGYSKYFNIKYARSGVLFQGPFKAVHIDSNEYLLHLSAYINLNNRAHKRGGGASVLSKSSWDEYINDKKENTICEKEIVLGQFSNNQAYKKFAEQALENIIDRKILIAELEESLPTRGVNNII